MFRACDKPAEMVMSVKTTGWDETVAAVKRGKWGAKAISAPARLTSLKNSRRDCTRPDRLLTLLSSAGSCLRPGFRSVASHFFELVILVVKTREHFQRPLAIVCFAQFPINTRQNVVVGGRPRVDRNRAA